VREITCIFRDGNGDNGLELPYKDWGWQLTRMELIPGVGCDNLVFEPKPNPQNLPTIPLQEYCIALESRETA